MSTRAFHHKNRHGCLTCKQRKKRCDLQKPVCALCERLGLRCTYESFLYRGSSGINDRVRLVQDPPHFADSLHQALASQPRIFEAVDFQLASHFLQTNSQAYATIPGLVALRHLDFTVVGLQYPYLIHGTLAASALYIASTQTDQQVAERDYYRERATFHQHYALSAYIKSLSTINAQSCQFIFGFSVILAGIQLASCATAFSGGYSNLQANQQTESIVEIFHLMQGSVAVAREASRWIPSCQAEPFLLPIQGMLQDTNSEIDEEVSTVLDALAAQIVQKHQARLCSYNGQPFDTIRVFLSALRHLRGVFSCISRGEPSSFKAVIGWPAFVDRSFIQMIKARQPKAFVILAFYGVALYSLRSAWWLQHIGSKLVLAVDYILHTDGAEEWYPFSAWTVSQVLHSETHSFPASRVNELSLASINPDISPSTSFKIAYDHICSVNSLGDESSTRTPLD